MSYEKPVTEHELLRTLSTLVSEERNPETMNLDTLSSLELVTKINQLDKQVPLAIEPELPHIASAVDAISAAFEMGGRLFYVGAGSSGRLGILDAAECPPTFGVDESMVIGLIAGGHEAIFKAQEGVEDSQTAGLEDLNHHSVDSKDVVVGLAASGRTPYVIGALQFAKQVGATTIALSCNPGSTIAEVADIAISPVVGPEALTGSTRMKSGTAQKMVLNMLTTASMVRVGKAYENLMVDVDATNEKLVARAINIVMQATDCSEPEAIRVLQQSNYEVKTAILMKLTGVSFSVAKKSLDDNNGFLRKAISDD